jgi:hypothetical protein
LLPFPSILVASHNDPYMPFERSRTLAQIWGSQFADAGETGHINAQSGLGDWTFGRFLLTRLAKEQVAARSSIIDRPVSDFDAVDPRIEGIGRRPALKNEGGKYD